MKMTTEESKASKIWIELDDDVAQQGLVARRYPIEGHALWFVQVRPSRQLQISILASMQSSKEQILQQLPTVKGLDYIFAPFDAYEHVLHVRVSDLNLNDQFQALVQDLLNSLILQAGDSIEIIGRRLLLWQKMFKVINEKLSDARVQGLVGELYLLNQLFGAHGSHLDVLKTWSGPVGGAQDFQNGARAIEVKSSLHKPPAVVRISSEWQLNLENMKSLSLSVVYLEENEPSGEGLYISDLISQTRELLKNEESTASLFEQRLIEARYFDKHEKLYTKKYIICDQQNFQLSDHSLVLNRSNLPISVTGVSYDLNTSGLQSFLASKDSTYATFLKTT